VQLRGQHVGAATIAITRQLLSLRFVEVVKKHTERLVAAFAFLHCPGEHQIRAFAGGEGEQTFLLHTLAFGVGQIAARHKFFAGLFEPVLRDFE